MKLRKILTTILIIPFTKTLSPNGVNKIRIGVSLGISEDDDSSSLINAVYTRAKQLNENSALISADSSIEILWMNTLYQTALAIPTAKYFLDNGVVGFIGAGYSSLSIPTSYYLQTFNIPQCCGTLVDFHR